MASITQRGSSYLARVRVTGFESQSASFSDYESALKWAKETEQKLKQQEKPRHAALESMTLRAALLKYQSTITPTKKGSKQESNRIDLIIKNYPVFVQRNIAEIETPHIGDFRDALLRSGYSSATIIRYIEVIRGVYKAIRTEWGYRTIIDPTHGLRMPRLNNGRTRRLSKPEYDQLLSSCDRHPSYWLRYFVILAVETAMRRSELVGLNWQQVNTQEKWVRLDDTKNGRRRFVPLSVSAIEAFEELKKKGEGSKVFPVGPDGVTSAFITAVKRAKIRDFRLHDLRHEATSRLIERGLSVFEVKEVTGQRTTSIVERYTHLRRDDLLKKLK